MGEAGTSAHDAKLAPVPVGNVEVSMFFDCGSAWQLRAGSCPKGLDGLGLVYFDLHLLCASFGEVHAH